MRIQEQKNIFLNRIRQIKKIIFLLCLLVNVGTTNAVSEAATQRYNTPVKYEAVVATPESPISPDYIDYLPPQLEGLLPQTDQIKRENLIYLGVLLLLVAMLFFVTTFLERQNYQTKRKGRLGL